MAKNIKVVAFSEQFQEMYFSKDIFLVPYYIAKETGGTLTYIYSDNIGTTAVPKEYRGCKITKSRSKAAHTLIMDIALKGRDIDVLFISGSSAIHMLTVWIYKHINPKGRVVIFGDMEAPQARELNANGFVYGRGPNAIIKSQLADYLFHNSTYIVANTEAYNIMRQLCERKRWPGLLHFYPCLDDELFYSFNLNIPDIKDREKAIVCVGRIGNHQKNTEMLLKALSLIDIKDWKIYMVGPITKSFNLNDTSGFQQTIDEFFAANPRYNGKLIFTGMVYDMREMFCYYLRARVLLSTSRHEGFANIYSQAAALGCYIISTDVGGADVGSNGWRYGIKIEQEDYSGLANVLTNLVNGRIEMDEEYAYSAWQMSYSYRVNTVLLPKMGLKPLAVAWKLEQ